MRVSGGTIAKIYADALFQLAKEQNILEERKDEVESLLEILQANDELQAVLLSPKVDTKEKSELVRAIFGDHLSRDLLNLVLLSFVASHAATAKTVIYFLMRRRADGTPTSEVHLEPRDEEFVCPVPTATEG